MLLVRVGMETLGMPRFPLVTRRASAVMNIMITPTVDRQRGKQRQAVAAVRAIPKSSSSSSSARDSSRTSTSISASIGISPNTIRVPTLRGMGCLLFNGGRALILTQQLWKQRPQATRVPRLLGAEMA
ncbi:unnamed protein product [Laminaria digitata]